MQLSPYIRGYIACQSMDDLHTYAAYFRVLAAAAITREGEAKLGALAAICAATAAKLLLLRTMDETPANSETPLMPAVP